MARPSTMSRARVFAIVPLVALFALNTTVHSADVTLFYDGSVENIERYSELAIDAKDQVYLVGDNKIAGLNVDGEIVSVLDASAQTTPKFKSIYSVNFDRRNKPYFQLAGGIGGDTNAARPLIWSFDEAGQLQGIPTPFDNLPDYTIQNWNVTQEGVLVLLVRHLSESFLARYSPADGTLQIQWSAPQTYHLTRPLNFLNGAGSDVYFLVERIASTPTRTRFSEVIRIDQLGLASNLLSLNVNGVEQMQTQFTNLSLNAFGELFLTEFSYRDNWRVFKRTSDGFVQQVIDSAGDGTGAVTTTVEGSIGHYKYRNSFSGNALVSITASATDKLGNLYIAGGESNNVFKIARDGTIRQILDATGDGKGGTMEYPYDMEVDSQGKLYVATSGFKVFRVAAEPIDDTTRYLASLQLSSENRQLPDETQIVYGDGAANMLDIRTISAAVMGLGGDDTVLAGNKYHVVYGGEGKDDVKYPFDLQDYALSQDPLTGDTEIIDKSGDSLGIVAGDVETLKFRNTETANAQLGYWGSTSNVTQSANAPVFRFFNVVNKSYFYTTSEAEAESILTNSSELQDSPREWPYVYQGATFAPARRHEGAVALHRFFNTQTGHHFFTANEQEVAFVQQQVRDAGWPFTYEGIAFNVYPEDPTPGEDGEDVPVHRFYSTSLNRHVFTASPREALLFHESGQWQYEGIGFYAENVD